MTTLSTILEMVTGEAKWIGRPDIHCYCHHPMREVVCEDGKIRWQRFAEDAKYSVICPDAGLLPGTWTTAAQAARTIDSILSQEAAA